MKIIKLALISAFAFAVLLTLLSLLFPSHVRISRAVNINVSESVIRNKVSDISSWKQWNDLYNANVNVKIESADSEVIRTIWQYRTNILHSGFTTYQVGNITVIQWYFDFTVKWYPWQKLGSIMFDKQFGPPMETSLNNLKKLLENSP